MAWVKTGTVAVTNGSPVVTGTGTSWFGALQTGWGFVGPDQGIYEILTVDSATQITLATPYLGANASAQSYAAFPTNSLSADLTATLQALISNYQGVYDTVGQGRFLDGTLTAPGMAFDADRDTGFFRPDENILALVAGAVEQLRLTGGVASGAAVQSNELDATAGKLMKVGAFGLGHNTQNLAPNNDVSDGIPSGFYTTDANTTGTGSETSVNGSLLHVARATGLGSPGAFQLWQRGVGDLLYRHFQSGVPTDWAAIYTTGNILGTVSQSGGVPTGAVIERGSNANGEYVRLADGTQICTHTMPTVATDTAFGGLYSGPVETWNFPAAFFGTPTVSGGVDGGSTNTTYRWLALGDIQLTSISFRQLSATLNAYTRGARLVAIGRWF